MINRFGHLFTALVIATLISIQRDGHGRQLIEGHFGLWLALTLALGVVMWQLWWIMDELLFSTDEGED